jgi:hypothetical protein
MAHLDLKRAALSVESAKQLTPIRNVKSSKQGAIRFIPTLPWFADLPLVEVLKPLRNVNGSKASPLCSHLLPRQVDTSEPLASAAPQGVTAAPSNERSPELKVAGSYQPRFAPGSDRNHLWL